MYHPVHLAVGCNRVTNLFVNDSGLAEVIAERCSKYLPDKEDVAACVLNVLKERQHNKFFQVKKGDLKDVIEIGIINEEQYDKDMERPPKKKIPLTTTLGRYDPDYMNWYAVIDRINGEDALTIVKKREGF